MDQERRGEFPDLNPGPNTTGTTGTAGDASGTAGGGGQSGSIARELQELGRQLANTVRAAWESEQRQEIQQEMTDGIRSLRDQLTETVETVRTNPRTRTMTQSMKEQIGKAAETTRVTEVVDDVREGLTLGLAELNDQLRRLSTRLERRDEAGGGDAATAGSAVSSVGGTATTPMDTQLLGGEGAGRAGAAPERAETAGTMLGAGLLREEPGLAPNAPIAGASQSELDKLDRDREGDRAHGLPDMPEGPNR